ncbi:hypothetical protein BDV95DRAFT_593009 [Massariosphaeria phaeospora]|uniref:Glucose-methanol-choline oxidoreductase N-terminal domain-containing protein n=1 Tax=Massariosphaeria phaeospora TaxID=100035 RepID=A0A7C8IAZ6_9PLEO|nr:hypothetical protein BDV95DRAFT_593009 [Massariosphaeria phaeospora]
MYPSQLFSETAEHLSTGWAEDFPWGKTGPLKASFLGVKDNPIGRAWVKTFENLGYPLTKSPFSGRSTGPYNCALSVDPSTATRSSSTVAYYLPVADRSNLKSFLGSLVDKIILEDKDKQGLTTTRVQLACENKSTVLNANKEVLFCAGIFNLPKIL